MYQELISKGVYLPPWDEIKQNEPIGATWNLSYLDQKVMNNKFNMSLKLYSILNQKGFYPKELMKWDHYMSTSCRDGYIFLQYMLHKFYPKLMYSEFETQIPIQKVTEKIQPIYFKNVRFLFASRNTISRLQIPSCTEDNIDSKKSPSSIFCIILGIQNFVPKISKLERC